MSHFSMIEARPLPGKKNRSISWRSREGRSVIYQIVAILSALALLGLLVRNTLTNMRLRGIQSGYDFLLQPFGFDISETMIEYASNSTYLVAFLIGMLNTLKVAVIGIVLATLLGVLVGVFVGVFVAVGVLVRVLVGVLPWRAAVWLSKVEPYGIYIVLALVAFKQLDTLWMGPLMKWTVFVLSLLLSPFEFLLNT
jgi:ABC-type phosphate/phosphonate transport system permease subunit